MSKFGKKFTCWKCSTKFYDLNKPSPKCPKCGADPEDDPNKGLPVAAPAAFGDELVEDIDEEMVDEVAEDEELEEEPAEDDAPGAGDDY